MYTWKVVPLKPHSLHAWRAEVHSPTGWKVAVQTFDDPLDGIDWATAECASRNAKLTAEVTQ